MNSAIKRFFDNMSERRMELIDGKLVIGNWLEGSRFMLAALLADWGAEAAVALAPSAPILSISNRQRDGGTVKLR